MQRLKVRIFLPIFSFWLVFIGLVPTNCFPWRNSFHKHMSRESAMVMPNYIRDILENHMYDLVEGTVEPDIRRIADYGNVSECASMIEKHAEMAEEMIRKGGDWEKIVFVLGQAAHYIQDLNQPQHCSDYITRDEDKAFERIVVYGVWNWKRDMYDGFHYIKKYREFAYNTARFSVRYVRYTTKWDLLGNDEFLNKLIAALFEHAVNDVADLWLTIFKNGLGEEKYKELGLPEPVGIRGDKEIKYEKIKDLEKVYLSPREEKK